jgi:hypothetical protein
MKDSGYPFKYHVELHRCLKQLLLNVIQQKNPKVLALHVKEVYGWLLNKLNQMGALSRSEQMAEADLLNPLAKTMGTTLCNVVKHKILSNLVDETEQRKVSMAMFEDNEWGSERTAHRQIPPASIRIQSVKTRGLKNFQSRKDDVNRQESALIERKQRRLMEEQSYQPGLVFANLGSQYDVSTSASTQPRANSQFD